MIKNFCAIVILIVAASFGIAGAASNEKILDAAVYDNAGILSAAEIRALTDKIHAVEQKHGIKIGVEFHATVIGKRIENVARETLEKNYRGAPNGGIVFVVDMDERNWYIATDSRMRNFIPNVNEISGGVVRNLKSGDYFSACSSYIDGVDQVLSYGAPSANAGGFNPMAAMIAVIGGIMIGVMVRSSLISGMSNVRHEAAALDYLKRETVKFDRNRDTYLFTNVERRPKPTGNGGGSGLSGGGGGGRGGSSGGGGGGSF